MADSYIENIFTDLHKIPEIGFKEFKTSKYIEDELLKCGFKVEKITETGLKATLDSDKPGPSLAIRADIDALSFIINDKEEFIHACAHDAHSAIVIAAGKEISETGIKKGKLILLFQPGEETGHGAIELIKSNKLNDLDELVGLHLRPIEELKLGEATPALIHSGGDTLNVTIKGITTHAARPHLGVNSIEAAILAANAVKSIHMNPSISHSIKLTKFNSQGKADNTIPGTTKICFDIRAATNEILDNLAIKAKTAIINSTESIGATADINEFGTPAADYDEELLNTVRQSIEKVMGKSSPPLKTNGCDDFHHYTKKLGIKTAFIGIGANLIPGLHSPNIEFNHQALEDGKEIVKDIIKKRLC
jgi:amidohydrolase